MDIVREELRSSIVSVSRARPAGWRLRYQLVGCLLFAAVIPYLLRYATVPNYGLLPQLNMTFLASMIAIIAGTWLLRSLSTYPGVEASSYILPAFSVSYGIVLLVYVFGRLEYNRAVLLTGYVGSVLWYYVVYFRVLRAQRLSIGLIAVEDSRQIETKRVRWVRLSTPDCDASELDAIALDLRLDLPPEWERRLADFALAGIPVYHIKHLVESLTGRVELEHLSESSFGSLTPISAWMSAKHAIDWLAALVAGVVLLPVLVMISLAIRLETPGPALFRQCRVGYRGRPFTVYKFRTMYVDHHLHDGPASAVTRDRDERITKLGRFLRRSRLDELPQILNILRGEMSWIGPRPEAEVLSRWYEAEIPFYRYRHIVRPGITGWAQVNQGHVAEISEVTSKLHYDFYYVKRFSPWLDILIVVRTVRTMLTGFGSR
jgi:lipopolysaccharide/colanic/teichoic acid biosynthesis glycosyltransferase